MRCKICLILFIFILTSLTSLALSQTTSRITLTFGLQGAKNVWFSGGPHEAPIGDVYKFASDKATFIPAVLLPAEGQINAEDVSTGKVASFEYNAGATSIHFSPNQFDSIKKVTFIVPRQHPGEMHLDAPGVSLRAKSNRNGDVIFYVVPAGTYEAVWISNGRQYSNRIKLTFTTSPEGLIIDFHAKSELSPVNQAIAGFAGILICGSILVVVWKKMTFNNLAQK